MQHRNAATQDTLRPLALVTSSYAARPRDPCARVQHSGRMAAGARTRCADALVQGLAPLGPTQGRMRIPPSLACAVALLLLCSALCFVAKQCRAMKAV